MEMTVNTQRVVRLGVRIVRLAKGTGLGKGIERTGRQPGELPDGRFLGSYSLLSCELLSLVPCRDAPSRRMRSYGIRGYEPANPSSKLRCPP